MACAVEIDPVRHFIVLRKRCRLMQEPAMPSPVQTTDADMPPLRCVNARTDYEAVVRLGASLNNLQAMC